MSKILDIQDLYKVYETQSEKLSVLAGVNLQVEEASRVVITGQSGSGKSTLLNIIGSIDSITSGSVQAGPWKVDSLTEKEQSKYRSEFLGLIFQFHYLLKDFTALENVYMPALIRGTGKTEAIEKAKQLLDEVGLSERINHLPSELSGGERQRVAVARALINDPSLILADEPTGNLDPSNSKMIGELLFSMVDRYKKTLILVTHDMSLAEQGSEIYSINNGKLEKLK